METDKKFNNGENRADMILEEAAAEAKKEEGKIEKLVKSQLFKKVLIACVAALAVFIVVYFYISNSRVYIEKAEITYPQIDLSAEHPGILEEVYVREGQWVNANQPLARVDSEIVKARVPGIVTSVSDLLGKFYSPGLPVVSMVNPNDMRVDGRVQEDKGLSSIRAGQHAIFTVDAFGSKTFAGVVDEVSPVSRQSDIVFSISDKREEKEFDVKVQFDPHSYPELKPGMSARLWVYK